MAEILAIVVLAAVLAGRETSHYYELKRRDSREIELLNRIKPETAQPAPGVVEPDRPAVDLFDDAEWLKHREELRANGRT